MNLGTMRLYHSTSHEAAASIYAEQRMRAGRCGMFGAAIYFADSKEHARRKSRGGIDVIITADVDLGRTLVLASPNHAMTLAKLNALGYNSIKGRTGPSGVSDYVVFESSRITLISMEGTLPFPPKPQLVSTKQFHPRNGAFNGIIAHLTRQCGGNVGDCQVVKITSSKPHRNKFSASNAADLASDDRFIGSDWPNWICYDFLQRQIVPTHYSLRAYDRVVINSWSIETSLTGAHDDWKKIDRQEKNRDLIDAPNIHTFEVSGAEPCRYVRLVQTGRNWSDRDIGLKGYRDHLFLIAWEIFGSLLE
jgi:hypothetical protein